MKGKKFSQKLNIKKTTVSNLKSNQIENAKGGYVPYTPDTRCCSYTTPIDICYC